MNGLPQIAGHDRKIGGGQIEGGIGEFRAINPAEGNMFVRVRRGTPKGEAADERSHIDHDRGVVVRETREGADEGDVAAEFFAQLAEEGGLRGLAGLDLAAGKFPLEGKVLVSGSLGDQHATGGVLDDGADDGNGREWKGHGGDG